MDRLVSFRKYRALRAVLGIAALGLLLLGLAACSDTAASGSGTAATATPGVADKDITTVPTRIETALLLSPPNVPPAITRDEPALVKVTLETTKHV